MCNYLNPPSLSSQCTPWIILNQVLVNPVRPNSGHISYFPQMHFYKCLVLCASGQMLEMMFNWLLNWSASLMLEIQVHFQVRAELLGLQLNGLLLASMAIHWSALCPLRSVLLGIATDIPKLGWASLSSVILHELYLCHNVYAPSTSPSIMHLFLRLCVCVCVCWESVTGMGRGRRVLRYNIFNISIW